MVRVQSHEIYEAEELLKEVVSWTDDEIERLPVLYRKEAQRYRRLVNGGEQ